MNIDDEISPDEDLVNKWRLAQGDLEVAINGRGKVNRAIPAKLTIVKELIRRGKFPYHYEIYGVGFLELRAAFRSPWAVRKMMGCIEQLGSGLSTSQVDSIYENVCKRVGKERIEIIQFILEMDERRGKRSEEHKGKDRRKDWIEIHKDCFDRLVTAMDEERTRVYEEQE